MKDYYQRKVKASRKIEEFIKQVINSTRSSLEMWELIENICYSEEFAISELFVRKRATELVKRHPLLRMDGETIRRVTTQDGEL